MPPVELTFEEAMAVVALAEEVGQRDQVPFFNGAARAAEKLRAQLPPVVLETIEPLNDRVCIDLARSAADDSCRDVYQQVRDAIARRRILVCRYEAVRSPAERNLSDRAGTDEEEFDFLPYALWFCQRPGTPSATTAGARKSASSS